MKANEKTDNKMVKNTLGSIHSMVDECRKSCDMDYIMELINEIDDAVTNVEEELYG